MLGQPMEWHSTKHIEKFGKNPEEVINMDLGEEIGYNFRQHEFRLDLMLRIPSPLEYGLEGK